MSRVCYWMLTRPRIFLKRSHKTIVLFDSPQQYFDSIAAREKTLREEIVHLEAELTDLRQRESQLRQTLTQERDVSWRL